MKPETIQKFKKTIIEAGIVLFIMFVMSIQDVNF